MTTPVGSCGRSVHREMTISMVECFRMERLWVGSFAPISSGRRCSIVICHGMGNGCMSMSGIRQLVVTRLSPGISTALLMALRSHRAKVKNSIGGDSSWDVWTLMITNDCSWLLTIAHDWSWLLFIANDYSWLLMIAHDCSWLLLIVHGCSWMLMIAHDCSWLLMIAHDCSKLLFISYDLFWLLADWRTCSSKQINISLVMYF